MSEFESKNCSNFLHISSNESELSQTILFHSTTLKWAFKLIGFSFAGIVSSLAISFLASSNTSCTDLLIYLRYAAVEIFFQVICCTFSSNDVLDQRLR